MVKQQAVGRSNDAEKSSTQTSALRHIPSEDDRKIFLGCLATVLASQYDYDVIEQTDTNSTEFSSATSIASTSSSSDLDSTDDDDNGRVDDKNNKAKLTRTESSFADNNTTAEGSVNNKNSEKRGFRRGRRRSVQRSTSSSVSDQQTEFYRKRRYEVLSELLLSGGKFLQLSNTEVGSFYVPILDRLLLPPTTRRRKDSSTFQGAQINPKNRLDVLNIVVDEIDNLQTFLEDLTPGAGVPCLAIFLLEYLICGTKGYDARVRHCIKKLGVIVILKEWCTEYREDMPITVVKFATCKFEQLERMIAQKLLEISKGQQPDDVQQSQNNSNNRRRNIIKGVKIGGAAVAAGVLFAMTAGMAAPAIAAGVAAVAGGTAVTATAAALLTSHVAVTAIFGVGGGGLAAYKMKRRVSGLTQFEIIKENDSSPSKDESTQPSNEPTQHETHQEEPVPELFSTVCVSGWLQDDKDFQRPWGVTPTKPPITNRVELMERFYSIHNPEKINSASSRRMQREYKNEKWTELCHHLQQMYGRSPDNLFPLQDEHALRSVAKLSDEESFNVESLFFELGCSPSPPQTTIPKSQSPDIPDSTNIGLKKQEDENRTEDVYNNQLEDESIRTRTYSLDTDEDVPTTQLGRQRSDSSEDAEIVDAQERLRHLTTVWDYLTTYGGELYTVHWERKLLHHVSDSMTGFGVEFVMQRGAAEILKHTALAALVAALAVPAVLAAATNVIDGPWTLTTERADEAGKELARSLLTSNAGNRPISLIGFSFGARVIYSCLKELAVYQQNWEINRMNNATTTESDSRKQFVRRSTSIDDCNIDMIREPASIVEDAIILGLPDRLDLSAWKACRQVVAGRLVHGFAQNDWVLSLMYKVKRVGLKPVCGTCSIPIPGVESVNLTDILSGHNDYVYKIGPILERIHHCEPFRITSGPDEVCNISVSIE